jgi:UPF0755 protein
MSTKKASSSSKTIRIMSRIVTTVVLIMLVIVLSIKGYNFGIAVFSKQGVDAAPGQNTTITIPKGADKEVVKDILYNNGLIKNTSTFNIQCYIYEAKFTAGEYTLNTSSSPEDIIETLKLGPAEEGFESGE